MYHNEVIFMTTTRENANKHAAFAPAAFFAEQQKLDTDRLQAMKEQSRKLVLLRTVSFLAMIFAFAAGYDGQSLFTLLGLLLLAAFVLLVRRHQKLEREQLLCLSHQARVKANLDRLTNKWMDFEDDGREFLREDLPQGADLPIFGHASLYQYLCCARTKAGRTRLAALLSPYPGTVKEMTARQQAVREIAAHPAAALDLLALNGLLPFSYDVAAFCAAMERRKTQAHPALKALSYLLPVLSFGTLFAALFENITYTIPGLLFLVQFLLALLTIRRHSTLLEPLYRLPQGLAIYQAIFARFSELDVTSGRLRELQSVLKKGGGAAGGLAALAAVADKAAMRRNAFVLLIANTLFLWDFHCTTAFLKWQRRYGASLRGWLRSWSELEALLSLAVPAWTRKHCCWPAFLSGAPSLMAAGAYPLLIREEKAVPNDAAFAAGTAILTGSNMSGKTTYMRTLAAAAILAYAGAPVCAASFSLTPMAIYTSIHVSDDPAKGLSTFYAEVLRIKQMVEACRREQPLFLCIDEIFKGTNSADRITGAEETLRHLTQPWCITLVTTHDFELCDLQSPNHLPIHNYHFEEHYENGQIRFDFKLHEGRCRTTNARYLLQMAGILPAEDMKRHS